MPGISCGMAPGFERPDPRSLADAADRSLAREIGKREPFRSPEQEAFLSLLRTGSALAADFAALFKAHGLSAPSYNVLRILRGHHPSGVPCQTIGRQLVARVPDVTRLVDRLERAGLAHRDRRHRDPDGCVGARVGDGRVVLVHITDDGLRLLERLDDPVMELHRAQLGHMNPEDLRELIRLLALARAGTPDGASSA